MTPEQKIAQVLKQIKDEAAINPDPRLMKFDFNYHVVGPGILSEDEERRILFKLEKEGVIKLRLSQYEDKGPKEVAVISSADGERYMTTPCYWVEILDGFENAYKSFSSHFQSTTSGKKEVEKQERDGMSKKDSITVLGDYFHGDKVGRDKNTDFTTSSKDVPLLLKWIVAIVAILTLVWGVYIYFKPSWQAIPVVSGTGTTFNRGSFSTTTPNLADIFKKTNSMLDLDKENFLRDFNDGPVYITGALFENINSSGEGFIVRMTVERNAVGCAFSSEFRKELLLLNKGDEVDFYGIFTGDGLGGYGAVNPWYITDCVLLK